MEHLSFAPLQNLAWNENDSQSQLEEVQLYTNRNPIQKMAKGRNYVNF